MTDIVERLRNRKRPFDFNADPLCIQAADEIERLREILRYIWSHGDKDGKVPYSWGQEYAERFIKLAKQEWERKHE